MKKLVILLLPLAMLFGSVRNLQAQSSGFTIKGVVVDVNDVPVIGAAVVEDGTQNNGSITDFDGKFSLKVSGKSATVTISSLGYQTIQLRADSPEMASGKIVLKDEAQTLDNAVVIGYGTVKKSDMTGSVAAIKAEEINRGAVSSSYELLQGKVSGLLVLPDGTLRIRGISSLNASNDPLIVVDGIPLGSNGLSSINPDDIDSFSVLKDASSAAMLWFARRIRRYHRDHKEGQGQQKAKTYIQRLYRFQPLYRKRGRDDGRRVQGFHQGALCRPPRFTCRSRSPYGRCQHRLDWTCYQSR